MNEDERNVVVLIFLIGQVKWSISRLLRDNLFFFSVFFKQTIHKKIPEKISPLLEVVINYQKKKTNTRNNLKKTPKSFFKKYLLFYVNFYE